jgi:hypothetical protein
LEFGTNLIQSLSKRWTDSASGYFDRLVRQAIRMVNEENSNWTIDSVVKMNLEEHQCSRGRAPSSMIYAAVCQAVLDNRPEYNEEFENPNAPVLV